MVSSARSKDPEMRIKVARMRPDSWRKTDSIVLRNSSIANGSALRQLQFLFHGRNGLYRAHLNAALKSAAGRGNLCCPGNGFVLVFHVQDVVARKLLLGFRKRPVCGHIAAILLADCSRCTL